MKPRRALVTGGTGFIGSHLAARLLRAGWDVHAMVRPDSQVARLPSLGKEAIHPTDGGFDSIRRALQRSRPDVVFHLASHYLSEHKPDDIPAMIRSNVLLGTLLLEAMDHEGVRYFVNAGTSWQHYEGRDYNPVNLYAAAKQAFESMLRYYVEARDLRAITLKLFDVYGKDDPRPKLLGLLLRSARDNEPLAMSPGFQPIDLVHVDDVARAFVLAAERLLAGHVERCEAYAVSSGQPITPRQLVETIEAMLGRKLPISWGGRAYREREVMFLWSGERIGGWHPEIDLSKGLLEIFGSC